VNTFSLRSTIFLFSLTAITSAVSQLPAKAQNTQIDSFDNQAEVTETEEENYNQSDTEDYAAEATDTPSPVDQSNYTSEIEKPATTAIKQESVPARTNTSAFISPVGQSNTVSRIETPQKPAIKAQTEKTPPVPGSTITSASILLANPAVSNSRRQNSNPVAQYEVEPGRETVGGTSYVGAGGNIGLTGDSGIGDNGFSLFAKIGLTRVFSVRPSVTFGNNTDFVIPITYDFSITAEPFQRINLAPFVGAGVVISTSQKSNFGVALTGGVDIPLSNQFTAVGSITIGFLDTTSVGLLLGLAYNFGRGFKF